MTNRDIRAKAVAAAVPMWELAQELGIGDNTLYRWLRTELPEEKRTAMLEAIAKLAKEEN